MPPTTTSAQSELEALREAVTQDNEARDKAADTAPQGQAAPEPKDELAAEADDSIPEKFRGKSAKEISEAYVHLEKQLGKQSSERAHSERLAEELSQRLQALEQQASERAQAKQEADPLENIDKEIEADPIGTVKKLADYVRQTSKRAPEQVSREIRRSQATDYFGRQMRENQDFAALEPQMRTLARQLAPLVKPEFIESPAMIDALYFIARGQNVPQYMKSAEEKAKKANDLVKQEKRAAFSESSSGSNGASSAQDFEKLSLDEMRKALGLAGGE